MSRAFTCLSDPAKRRHYDAHGHEEGAGGGGGFGGRGGRGGGPGFGGFYGQEVDPEDLFNMWVAP